MRRWSNIPVIGQPTALTIGNFDGVHIGHQALLDKVRSLCGEGSLSSAAITFDNHPLDLIAPHRAPRLLLEKSGKAALLHKAGIHDLISLHFDRTLADTGPEEFIGRIRESIALRHVVVGFNFRFGRNGAGDGRLLAGLGTSLGFEVTVMPPVLYEGEPVSSTRIRAALSSGDCVKARAMLGRPYGFSGTVAPGFGNGKRIGFPTANVEPRERMLIPANGVYAARVRAGGAWRGAMTNIGVRPTARQQTRQVSIESHIMGFEGDLYGETVRIEFIEKIRDERVFESWDALATQLRRDREAVLAILERE